MSRPSWVALGRLRSELKGSDIVLAPSGIMSFDAVRVVGPVGELLVSVRARDEDGIDFLAAPEPDLPDGPYEPLGAEEQLTEVAGIIRRRVGAT
ncbi:hypothetical protein [Actinocorallia libanotica]|uniref:DUF5753 domain-containing protein n=1 Tax=Actinocorallia libanotica TaxID=46162 RepID=A0ABP4CAJ1_9ACTN